MNKYESFSGDCPYTNTRQTITITYIDYSDMSEQVFKRGQFNCDHSSNCPYTRTCPIYIKSPKEI